MPGKHQHFQEPEVGCCGKYFLFGFNIVFWVLGALFLAIGLWAWGEKGVLSNISALTDLGGLDPVWLFVVVGGVMSVLGFAGCIGALRENTFLLKFFSVFLGLIFFLELATGILAFVFKDWIRDQLNLFINNNVKAYRDDIDLQNLIDFAQEYWSCCGARGPNDWNLNIYFNCTDLNPSRERCGVPFSCCVRDPAQPPLQSWVPWAPGAPHHGPFACVSSGRRSQHPVRLRCPAQTGAGAAGLHLHERLCGAVREVAAGQPDCRGRGLRGHRPAPGLWHLPGPEPRERHQGSEGQLVRLPHRPGLPRDPRCAAVGKAAGGVSAWTRAPHGAPQKAALPRLGCLSWSCVWGRAQGVAVCPGYVVGSPGD
ncbi:tetraspanin 17 [Phyllostomus discolor]|uniref:Tetraspanin 17 n=1 Tax=Phyllostomus discolor TaxID=89673 RepID=A0A834DJL4_9CHIR|nr:tetraspanin 17 [Phyllostomus discolor]